MEIREMQNKITEFAKSWEKKWGVSQDERRTVMHLTEELGELAKEYINMDMRKSKFNKEKLNNAIADCFFQLFYLAEIRGLDLDKLLTETMDEDYKRISS